MLTIPSQAGSNTGTISYMAYGRTLAAHTHYRAYRRNGMSKIESLQLVKMHHWPAWVEMCKCQENGEQLDTLDQKDESKQHKQRITGKLD